MGAQWVELDSASTSWYDKLGKVRCGGLLVCYCVVLYAALHLNRIIIHRI